MPEKQEKALRKSILTNKPRAEHPFAVQNTQHPRISRPINFESKISPKLLGLYASVYGTYPFTYLSESFMNYP